MPIVTNNFLNFCLQIRPNVGLKAPKPEMGLSIFGDSERGRGHSWCVSGISCVPALWASPCSSLFGCFIGLCGEGHCHYSSWNRPRSGCHHDPRFSGRDHHCWCCYSPGETGIWEVNCLVLFFSFILHLFGFQENGGKKRKTAFWNYVFFFNIALLCLSKTIILAQLTGFVVRFQLIHLSHLLLYWFGGSVQTHNLTSNQHPWVVFLQQFLI